MPVIEVGEHTITLRDVLPAKENWDLVETVRGFAGKIEYDAAVNLCSRTVESWDFAGDPANPVTYESMDLMDVLAITGVVADALGKRLRVSKNLTRPPTSP